MAEAGLGRWRLLISDLDGTLLGDDASLRHFAVWYRAHRKGRRLVYATGRALDSVLEDTWRTALPVPHAIITAVGTEIHDPSGRSWPGWPPDARGWSLEGVRTAMAAFPEFVAQPITVHTPWKASYTIRGLTPSRQRHLRDLLRAAGYDVNLVYSSNRDLDVLPATAGKGPAARFIAGEWGVPPHEVLVSGDSGNDADLFVSGFKGIVVANAQPELKRLVGPDVYHSPQAFAAGVLDGIDYWQRRE